MPQAAEVPIDMMERSAVQGPCMTPPTPRVPVIRRPPPPAYGPSRLLRPITNGRYSPWKPASTTHPTTSGSERDPRYAAPRGTEVQRRLMNLPPTTTAPDSTVRAPSTAAEAMHRLLRLGVCLRCTISGRLVATKSLTHSISRPKAARCTAAATQVACGERSR
jgi:hypothetical protein